ncbi:MAG: hypothetical protein AAB307_03630 [Deltaproteobacteria bacterium]
MKSRKKAIMARPHDIGTQKTGPVTQPLSGRDLIAAHAPERIEREFFNKNEYILDWLAGEPQKNFSPTPDIEKRLDILLTALHKERKNVLQFKVKQNKS